MKFAAKLVQGTILCSLVCTSTAHAESPLRAQVDLSVLTARPYEGAESIGDWGVGLGFSGGVAWGPIPLTLGVDVMPVLWGSHTYPSTLQSGALSFPATITRKDQSILFDAWLRLEPPLWMVRPYLEGFIGTKFLQTKYTAELHSSGGDASVDETTDNNSASSIGWGAGVAIRATEQKDPKNQGGIFVTLGFRSMHGGAASYSRAISTSEGLRQVDYRSDTDSVLVMLSIGAKIDFSAAKPPPPPDGTESQ